MSDIDDIEHWIQDLSDPYHVVQKKEAAIKALREMQARIKELEGCMDTPRIEDLEHIAELEGICQRHRALQDDLLVDLGEHVLKVEQLESDLMSIAGLFISFFRILAGEDK